MDMTVDVDFFSTDDDGRAFRCEELLNGTRSSLASGPREAVDVTVQEYLRDPSSIPPPASTTLVGVTDKPFGVFYDAYSKVVLESRSYEWFDALTSDEAL